MIKEILQQAHDALEGFEQNGRTDKALSQGDAAIVALRAAMDHPVLAYDQSALELCEVCWWKTLIPGDCCLNCERFKAIAQPKGKS